MDCNINYKQLQDMRCFIELLTARNKILAGGASYESWASELLDLCLKHREVHASGALLIPQFGINAGQPEVFQKIENKFSIPRQKLKHILEKHWLSKTQIIQVFDVSSKNNHLHKCIFCPISYGFDRPIGYFWAVANLNEHESAIKVLEYASILVSICIRSEKACKALQLMSEPSWQFIEDTKSAAVQATEMSLKALSCRASIIWFMDQSTQILDVTHSAGHGCSNLRVDIDSKHGHGLAGICATENRIILVDNLYNDSRVAHKNIVKKLGFASAIFVPLDAGGYVAGVLGVYASRLNAFSELDKNIVQSIAQWLSARIVRQERIEEARLLQNKIDFEMPLIEAGLMAMARVHDAKDQLFFAQNVLSQVTSSFPKNQKDHSIKKKVLTASEYIDQTKNIIDALVSRAKLSHQYFKKRSLYELLKNVCDAMEETCNNLKINVYLECQENIFINMDHNSLRRVFQNLFDNAIHFIVKKGVPRKIKISVTCPENTRALISFYDSGPGIPPTMCQKVFDVFFTTKGERGMGFGLAISKRIISQHNGSIKVKSIWGDFTEFIIDLPCELKK